MSFPVMLNVYDLTESFSTANKVMKWFGTGVYHCGVAIHGNEYSYGQTEDETSGVFEMEPENHPVHAFKQAVHMGDTCKTEEEVLAIVQELSQVWMGLDYHLLDHNCCDFSNELCKRLDVGQVPGWVKSAAGVGSSVNDALHFRATQSLLTRGKESRRATEDDTYKFGDLTRGGWQKYPKLQVLW
jgi:hypothetical protein